MCIHRIARSLWIQVGLTAVIAVALSAGLGAAGNLQILTLELNNVETLTDDIAVQTDIHWAESDIPVRFFLYRPRGGNFIPFSANVNLIPDYRVQQAANRALQAWSDLEINGHGGVSDFEFSSFALPFDFIGDAFLMNPAGLVQLDGFNTITFYDGEFVGDALGVSGAFTVLRDFNLFDLFPLDFEIPIGFLGDNIGGQGAEVIGIDIDGDGFADMVFRRTEFERGQILDSDTALTAASPFVLLPEDPDDIPDLLFEDIVLGATDLELVMTHELGHTVGLCHSYIFEPIMTQFLWEDLNPYNRREPHLDDVIGVALTYPGGGLDDLGGIAGSLISGAEADGVNPADFTPLPPNPQNMFLFQNPVFVGVPEPSFDLETPQLSGTIPAVVNSNDGPIRLITWVYAGNDVVWPNSPYSAGQPSYNSDFLIPGLEPRDDYRLYTLPQPIPYSYVALGGVFEAYEAEFFGGATPINLGVGTGVDQNDATDNTFENAHIQVGVGSNGQFTVGFDSGPDLLFGHPTPSTSFTTVRVIASGETHDYHNRFQNFGATIQGVVVNDGANSASGIWEVAPGLQIRQDLRLIAANDSPDNVDDVRIQYELSNISSVNLMAGVRIMLDTIVDSNESVPFLIGGREYTSTTTFEGASIPRLYELINPVYPRIRAQGRLGGTGASLPSRFVIGFFPDLFQSLWTVSGSGSFTNPGNLSSDGAVVIFFDPVPLGPGETTSFSTVYGGYSADNAVPESGIPEGEGTTTDGGASDYADDPLGTEPITVLAGQVTGPINIFTNTGVEPPGLTGNTDEDGPVPVDPVFGNPINEEGGEPEFPIDQDASIDIAVGDVDNDGDLDIVYANALTSGLDPSSQINRLYLNGGFDNELAIGEFIDATFGRNGISDGPPPLGDDRLPVIYDADPTRPGIQSDLINEASGSVVFGDFDKDGWLDLFVANFASLDHPEGGQNRIFMNREGVADGETFRHFEDETLGDGITPRLPGVLNGGPFNFVDFSFRSDTGDIDNDGDLDIIVMNERSITTGQIGEALLDPPGLLPIVPSFNLRVLLNDSNGYFFDGTLGQDGLFGGGGAGPSIETSADRDRIPPNMWDYNQAPGSLDNSDQGRHTEAILAQLSYSGYEDIYGTALDIMQVSTTTSIGPASSLMEGQEQLFVNMGDGHFANVTWGGPPSEGPCDYFVDPDILDEYPMWTQTSLFSYPPAMIGWPDAFESDINTTPTTEEDQIPPAPGGQFSPVEDDSFGGAAVDIDHDGTTDIVLANMSRANRIITFEFGIDINRGSGRSIGGYFDEIVPTDYLLAVGLTGVRAVDSGGGARTVAAEPNRRCREVAVGDVDLDGDPDAYFAVDGIGAENIVGGPAGDILLLNDGQGNLTGDVSDSAINLGGALPTYDVELVDIDNDGDLDAILAVFTEQNLYLENFLINGLPTPTRGGDIPLFTDHTNEFLLNSLLGSTIPGTPAPYTNSTSCAVFADFDGDDDLDLYIGNGTQSFTDSNIYLVNTGRPINDGVRVYKAAHTTFPAPQLVQGLHGAFPEGGCDANFDGNPDTVNGLSPTVDVDVADFDNDGDWDIFVTNNGFRNSILINADTKELGLDDDIEDTPLEIVMNGSRAYSGGLSPGIVHVEGYSATFSDADVLGDGLMVDTTGISLPGLSAFDLFNADGLDPSTTSSATYGRPDLLDQTLELSRGSAVGDLNGDGRVDIFVANGAQGGIIKNTLLINQGILNNGVPEFQAVNDPFNDGRFTPEDQNVRNSFDAAIFDADNDGDLDIYVADGSVTSEIAHTLWINDGTARFTARTVIIEGVNGLLGQNTVELLVGDFDADGEPTEDINGNGFLDPGEDTDGDRVIDFIDYDGDGIHDRDYDILLCNTAARDIMLINDGLGFFTDESDVRVPDEDRNQDGFLDPDEDSDDNGEIGPVIRNSFDADAADVDLDGDLDIVIAQDFPDPVGGTTEAVTLQLLINDGTGVFSDQSDHEIGTTHFSAVGTEDVGVSNWNANSRSVEFGDVDRDGDPDLFIGNIGQVASGIIVGNYNVLMLNRAIGANLNALSRDVIRTSSLGPIITGVFPNSALAIPQDFIVRIAGFNFQEGAQVNMGAGIDTLSTRYRLPSLLEAHIRILPGATAGPRIVSVENPDGRVGTSAAGDFSLGQPLLTNPGDPLLTPVSQDVWSVYR